MDKRPLFLIMHDARKDFREIVRGGEEAVIAACLAFGTVHLYVAERHRARHPYHPLAIWHFWMAARLANRAIELRKSRTYGRDGVHAKFRHEEARVVAEILDRTPYKLGGNSRLADNIRSHAGNGKNEHVFASDRAKVLITLGRGYQHVGEMNEAKLLYHQAHSLIPEIEAEDPAGFPTPKQRVVEVLRWLGFSYFDSGIPEEKNYGETLVNRASDIARGRFPELHGEIEKEWIRKRGFRA